MTDSSQGWQPSRPTLTAAIVYLAAGLTLFWPILTGQFLAGPHSDQFVAGYGFRLFGAEAFRQTGHIPLWNPYLFGGLPFVGAMHGDIFYPTAWLRWLLPTDLAMSLGFAVHLVLAGLGMYWLLRALGSEWGGALVGGLAWELSGIVASLVHPGHDGKLFVAAVTPLLFLAVWRVVGSRSVTAYGLMALMVGLSLHGHPQASYYLLVAAGLWGAWLLFLSPARPAAGVRLRVAAGAVGAVALGFGLYAIQALPFIEYIPYSPRAAGGSSGGWEYATAFSLPPAELLGTVLPEFNGIIDRYWGSNFFKLHTEYLGVIPVVLALIGAGDRARRPLVFALGGIGALFLLVALGGHTPFYRAWYAAMPMMQKVRAPGMAFFLTAFPVAILAGFGADRLLGGDGVGASTVPRRALVALGTIAGLGVLAAGGLLQGLAEALVDFRVMTRAVENGPDLRVGGLRVLGLAALGLALVWAIRRERLRGRAALGALALLTVLDLWSVDRKFFVFQPPAVTTYAWDEVTRTIAATELPYRAWDPYGVYPGSWLMAHRIPTLLGYHGNELHRFDELLGGKNVWDNQGSPAIWSSYALQWLIWPDQVEVPGFRHVLGPVATTTGQVVHLYQADPTPSWARVYHAGARVPESELISTLVDPRFPADRIVLFGDSARTEPPPLPEGDPPAASPATVTRWEPGRMTITLPEGGEGGTLVVAENWYPDWTARLDGEPVAVERVQYALLGVPVPPGGGTVDLEFRSRAYERGRLISGLALIASLALLAGPLFRRRTRRD